MFVVLNFQLTRARDLKKIFLIIFFSGTIVIIECIIIYVVNKQNLIIMC